MLFSRLLNINPDLKLPHPDPQYYDNFDTMLRTIQTNTKMPDWVIMENQGVLWQIFSRFMHHATRKIEVCDNRVAKIINYIQKNIDKTISLNELASLSYISPNHLTRIFKQQLGETPLQYINKHKIQKAQLLLVTTNFMVKDIAYSLSFNNLSYFTRLFMNRVGVTPQCYRDNHRR